MEIDPRLKDKGWRVNNLYKIIDKDANLVVFRRNKVQKHYSERKALRNIILKARQEGFTTEACIDCLDDVLFKPYFNATIIAHDRESLLKIFSKVKLAWDQLDSDLKAFLGIKANTDKANQLSFNNNSTISVALSSRSDTVHKLHVSEFGKICAKYPQKAREIITGAFQSVPDHGEITIESTAEGEFGEFYEMFWDAWESPPQNPTQFKAHFYGWQFHDDYKTDLVVELNGADEDYAKIHGLTGAQIRWYVNKRNNLPARTKHLMPQEFPTTPEEAFVSSGVKMFEKENLDWQAEFIKEGRTLNGWDIFEEYNPKHKYAIGADVAEGVGQDSSTAYVFDFTAMEVVAEFESNAVEPDTFGHILYRMAEKYGDCLIAPERNNCGLTTVTKLKELGANMYFREEIGRLPGEKRRQMGWRTTSASKPLMMYELKDAIDEKSVKIRSEKLLRELRSYDKQNLSETKFDPEQTNHWDRVIAFAITWQMRKHLDLRGKTPDVDRALAMYMNS